MASISEHGSPSDIGSTLRLKRHAERRALVCRIATLPLLLTVATSFAANDWPSYNRTLTSDRYSPLTAINAGNVAKLRVLCTYDTEAMASFQTGLIVADGALYGTTDTDTFSINPASCKLNWRVHEDYKAASPLKVNRGVAYLDGRLFRGTQDGRVLAYDAHTGKRLWERAIGDPAKGETVPAAPVAWNGLVFAGNAGGDIKGVRGRMYALDAASGNIVWQFELVPKDPGDKSSPAVEKAASTWRNPQDVPIAGGATWTSYSLDPAAGLLYVPGGNPAPDFAADLRPGDNLYSGSVVVLDARTGAYKTHYPIAPHDFHDWDVSAAPALVTTRAHRDVVALTPKDGHLYAIDRASGRRIFKTAVTRVENAETPISPSGTHFCPGTQGGAEWNGPAYDPMHDVFLSGAVEWCATVKLADASITKSVADGQPWTGHANEGQADVYGKLDDPSVWAGWFYAVDATTGKMKWNFKSPFPLMSGITPTAGGVVFFGDMGGNLYAFDTSNGRQLWTKKMSGALAGGIITYETDGAQRVAVAAGMTSPIWPTEKTTAKVVVLGIE